MGKISRWKPEPPVKKMCKSRVPRNSNIFILELKCDFRMFSRSEKNANVPFPPNDDDTIYR